MSDLSVTQQDLLFWLSRKAVADGLYATKTYTKDIQQSLMNYLFDLRKAEG